MKQKIVRESLNELAGHEDKDPHGDFRKAKDILLNEIGKYIKDDVIIEPTIIAPDELMDLIAIDTDIDKESMKNKWKNVFMEEYVGPIIDALEVIQTKVQGLEEVHMVGDLKFPPKPKRNWRQKIRDIGPLR